MQGVMRDNGELLGQIQNNVNKKVQGLVDSCFDKNIGNVDKFVTCIQDKTKLV